MALDTAYPYLKQIIRCGDAESDESVILSVDDSPIYEKILDDIAVFYVLDEDDSFLYISNRRLKEEKSGLSEVRAIAMGNLRRLPNVRVCPHSHIWAILAGGNFEATLLIDDSFWEWASNEFKILDLVAAIPARDILAFADMQDDQGIKELIDIIGKVWPKGDHLLTKSLIQRVNGKWVKCSA